MSVDGDGKVVDLAAKFNIRELIEHTSARRGQEAEEPEPGETGTETLPPLDQLVALPSPGDRYKAHARPANQVLPTLFILKGDGQKWAFPYSGLVEGPHMLSGDDPGKGLAVVLRFSASVTVDVTLVCRNVDDLHNYLGYHRIAWVRELPKGKIIKDDGSPVITRIAIGRAESWPPLGMG
jgi:hypothetical protein